VSDGLPTYAVKTGADGVATYDCRELKPELAESWQVAPDGKSATFVPAPTDRLSEPQRWYLTGPIPRRA
jgi:hypothetical protein